MLFLFAFVIFGFVGGVMVNSLMGGRGSLSSVWIVGLGVAGSLILGMLLFMFGRLLVGDGPDTVLALLAALVGAVVVPLVATIIKK